MNPTTDHHEWLTLKQAAARLNVHPTTLRRWADEGQIAVMLTPGGHRRFAESDVDNLSKRRHNTRRLGPIEQIWAKQAIERTRERIMARGHKRWLEQHDDNARHAGRMLGQELMMVTVRYLTSPDADPEVVKEARRVGQQYGDNSRRIRLPLTDALQASMFFRDTLVSSALELPDNVRIPKAMQTQILKRIDDVINEVVLGIAEAYDPQSGGNS